MARITDVDVIELIDVDSSISLDPFISAANELVTELCTSSSYSDTRLEMIEAWLAAHFYLMRDQAVDTAKAGSVSVKYQYKIGLQLAQTKQGQTAMMLDTAGNLANLSKKIERGRSATAGVTWAGTDLYEESEAEE